MFDIINAIESSDEKLDWLDDASSGIDSVEVCSFSGYKPNDWCSEKKLVPVLKNAYPNSYCPYHNKYLVEKKTNFRICPDRLYRKGEIVEKVFIILPPLVQDILKYGKEPSFPPNCVRKENREKIVILQPVDGATYIIPKEVRNTEFIPLQGYTSSKDNEIFWFVNNRYIGKTISGEIMNILPKDELLEILAQDKDGNRNYVKVFVKFECGLK